MFDEMRKGLQQIEFIKQPDVGELRIGSSIVTDAGLLPAIIERFSQEFPRAVVNVLPENIAIQQYDNLRDRKVELVFGRLPTTMTEPDMIAEPKRSSEAKFCCDAKRHTRSLARGLINTELCRNPVEEIGVPKGLCTHLTVLSAA